jgi:hypothetical protein
MAREWHMDKETAPVESVKLDELRTRAQDALSAKDWAALHRMRPDLEADVALWADFWGPMAAVAARRMGDDGAMALLQSLVDGGFRQPELFGGLLEETFGDDPEWSGVAERMRSPVGPAPVTLLEWPVIKPTAPLGLFSLPDREAELRALIPSSRESAWETACSLLDWVTHRWRHANAHMEVDDAVECLRRVDEGHRYACVEYSLVLSQALNARRIPARRVWLRQRDYHVGLGRAHVVSEAWIDDLARWVVLDGQNGLYWVGEDRVPLGAVDLQRLALQGAARPAYVTHRDDLTDQDADLWFSYFAHASTTAGTWSPGPLAMMFQRDWIVTTGRLEQEPSALYPDLSEIGVETAITAGQPALRLLTAHPYHAGFVANGRKLDTDVYPLDLTPGEHVVDLAVATAYGALPAKRLRYQVT